MNFKAWLEATFIRKSTERNANPDLKRLVKWKAYWKSKGFSDEEIETRIRKASDDSYQDPARLETFNFYACQKFRKFLMEIFPIAVEREAVEAAFNKDQITQSLVQDLCTNSVTKEDVEKAVANLRSLGLLKDIPDRNQATNPIRNILATPQSTKPG